MAESRDLQSKRDQEGIWGRKVRGKRMLSTYY
jgi:hypothetical protein